MAARVCQKYCQRRNLLEGVRTGLIIAGTVDLLKRHSGYSLGPGAVRGISPRGRRKEAYAAGTIWCLLFV